MRSSQIASNASHIRRSTSVSGASRATSKPRSAQRIVKPISWPSNCSTTAASAKQAITKVAARFALVSLLLSVSVSVVCVVDHPSLCFVESSKPNDWLLPLIIVIISLGLVASRKNRCIFRLIKKFYYDDFFEQ